MSKSFLLFFGLGGLVLLGCGKSPLLHHVNADEIVKVAPKPPGSSDHDASCALWLASSKLCAELTWQVTPTDDVDGELTLSFWDPAHGTSAGPYLDPTLGTPALQLWMPAMGHGSRATRVAKEADGVYRVTHIVFTMPGDWELRVQVKAGANVVDQAVLPYKF